MSQPVQETHDKFEKSDEIVDIEDLSDEEDSEHKNLCTMCGIDMGPQNPRQLCGKTRCLEKGYWFDQPSPSIPYSTPDDDETEIMEKDNKDDNSK